MRKHLIHALPILLIAGSFAACSSKDDSKKPEAETGGSAGSEKDAGASGATSTGGKGSGGKGSGGQGTGGSAGMNEDASVEVTGREPTVDRTPEATRAEVVERWRRVLRDGPRFS